MPSHGGLGGFGVPGGDGVDDLGVGFQGGQILPGLLQRQGATVIEPLG